MATLAKLHVCESIDQKNKKITRVSNLPSLKTTWLLWPRTGMGYNLSTLVSVRKWHQKICSTGREVHEEGEKTHYMPPPLTDSFVYFLCSFSTQIWYTIAKQHGFVSRWLCCHKIYLFLSYLLGSVCLVVGVSFPSCFNCFLVIANISCQTYFGATLMFHCLSELHVNKLPCKSIPRCVNKTWHN